MEICHEGYGSGAFRWHQLEVMRRKQHYGRTLTTSIFLSVYPYAPGHLDLIEEWFRDLP